VATYKRLHLFTRRLDRGLRLLADETRPIQVVIAGKAHPSDDGAKRVLQSILEPGADIASARQRIVRNHIAHSGPIVIDARMKPTYPKELFCDDDTARVVSNRWKEYFPSRHVEMGDSGKGHLD